MSDKQLCLSHEHVYFARIRIYFKNKFTCLGNICICPISTRIGLINTCICHRISCSCPGAHAYFQIHPCPRNKSVCRGSTCSKFRSPSMCKRCMFVLQNYISMLMKHMHGVQKIRRRTLRIEHFQNQKSFSRSKLSESTIRDRVQKLFGSTKVGDEYSPDQKCSTPTNSRLKLTHSKTS